MAHHRLIVPTGEVICISSAGAGGEHGLAPELDLAVGIAAGSRSGDLLSYPVVLIGRDLCEDGRGHGEPARVLPVFAASVKRQGRMLQRFNVQLAKAGLCEDGA